MIDLSTPNEWQHKDESLDGILFPWYTKPFLDELVTWDLKESEVFEFGCGASTIWWARKAKRVRGIENNIGFLEVVNNELYKFNGIPSFINYDTDADSYSKAIYFWKELFDIVIIDGDPVEWRDACVKPAIECLKPGGKLIIDNWLQPSVWMASEETRQLLSPYPCTIYKQDGHHDWQTSVFTI